MKSLLLRMPLALILLSCNDTYTNNKVSSMNADTVISDDTMSMLPDTSKDVDIPINIKPSTDALFSNNQLDSNLINQLDEYQKAVLSGNADLAYTFYYRGAVNYIKDMFPNENIDDDYIKENVLKMTYNMIKKLNETKNTDFEYIIKDVVCKQEYNGTLIYVVNTSLDANVSGERKSMPSKTIGISDDSGLHWTFMSVDEETTRPILTKYFNSETADKVINCN